MTQTNTRRRRHGNARVGVLLLAGLMVGGAIALGVLLPPGSTQSVQEPTAESDDPTIRPLPSFRVEPAQVDFGTLRPNQLVEREFVVENVGHNAIRIQDIVPSCSCLSLEPEFPKALAPGVSMTVKATLHAPPFQDAPLRFDLMIACGPKFKTLKIPAIGRTTHVFELERGPTEGDKNASIRVHSVDGKSFSVMQVPWFVISNLDDLKDVSEGELVIETERSKAMRISADPRPTLVLQHQTIGEVRIPWREPDQLPRMLLPPIRPTSMEVSLSLAELQGGAEVEIELDGILLEEAAFLDVHAEGMREGSASLIEVMPRTGGTIARVLVQSNSDRWPGGGLVFTWNDQPVCSIRLVESTR